MLESEIDRTIREMLGGVLPKTVAVTEIEDHRPLAEKGLDSLAMIQVLDSLQGAGGFVLEAEDFEDRYFSTIGGLKELFRRKIGQAA